VVIVYRQRSAVGRQRKSFSLPSTDRAERQDGLSGTLGVELSSVITGGATVLWRSGVKDHIPPPLTQPPTDLIRQKPFNRWCHNIWEKIKLRKGPEKRRASETAPVPLTAPH